MSISGNRLTLNATTTANLQASSTAFKLSDEDLAFEGYDYFLETPTEVQNKVYEQLWVNKNKPMGDHRYGEFAFFNMHGRRSTYQEKAEAIDKFIISSVILTADSYDQRVALNTDSYDQRLQANAYVNEYRLQWNQTTRKYDYVEDVNWYKWGKNMEKILIPTEKDSQAKRDAKNCVAIGGAIGILALGVLYVVKEVKELYH
jgi:hypothetical protein